MSDDWYVRTKKIHGPLTDVELKKAASTGLIGPETPVRDGLAGRWLVAKHIRGLSFGRADLPVGISSAERSASALTPWKAIGAVAGIAIILLAVFVAFVGVERESGKTDEGDRSNATTAVSDHPQRKPVIAERPSRAPVPASLISRTPIVAVRPVSRIAATSASPLPQVTQAPQVLGRLGRELFPKVTARVNAEKAAAEELDKCFQDFPANCWRADKGRKVTVLEKNPRTVKLLVEFSIVQDRKAYSDLIKRARPLLMELSKARGTPPAVKLQRDSARPGLISGRMPFGSKDASSLAANYETGDSMLYLNTTLSGADERSQKSGWTCFVFDKKVEPSLTRLRGRIRSRIRLLDGNKKTLAQGYEKIGPFQYGQNRFGVAPSVTKAEIPIGQTKGRMPVFFFGPVLFASPETDSGEDSFSGLWSLIFPGDGQNDGGIPFAFSHGVSCGHIFSLSLDELKALDHITVEVIPDSDRPTQSEALPLRAEPLPLRTEVVSKEPTRPPHLAPRSPVVAEKPSATDAADGKHFFGIPFDFNGLPKAPQRLFTISAEDMALLSDRVGLLTGGMRQRGTELVAKLRGEKPFTLSDVDELSKLVGPMPIVARMRQALLSK